MKLKRPGTKKPPERREAGRQRRNSLDNRRPTAFSYHAQRSERPDTPGRQQPSAQQKRSRLLSVQFWARRSGLLIVITISLICLVSIVSLSTQPRIILLDSNGNQHAFRSADAYQQAAASYLSGSIWNRNKLTVNSGAASSDLAKHFPELSDVTITLPLIGHRPIYYLQANKPGFILQSTNGTFVLDSTGVALVAKDSAQTAQIAGLPTITDQTGLHVAPGSQVISRSDASFITTVLADLTAKKVAVDSLILPANAVQELDVRVQGSVYVVKFNMHDAATVRQQAGTYLATINTLAGQQATPSQYIDVRVTGRAYYQ